jgi:hypothetical protein
VTTFLAEVAYTVPTTFKLGLALVSNSVTVFLDTGAGWTYVTGIDVGGYYDFRVIGNLTGWRPSLFAASKGGLVTWRFSNLKTGRFGGTGIRDETIVTEENGSPFYPTENSVLFTATLPDPRGIAYAGLFSLDLGTYALTQIGALMVSRDGKIYADLVPHIIHYSDGSQRLTISTWGNGFGGSLQVLYKRVTDQNLLAGTNIVSGMSLLNLPGQSGEKPGAYDQMLAYDTAQACWRMVYAITADTSFSGSPFCVAEATSTDLSAWTLVGKDSAHLGYEGVKLLLADGVYWVLAGGPAGAATQARVYSAGMAYQGVLDAVFEGGASTQPHPMVFPAGDKQVLITFDATNYGGNAFTWGNFLVYTAPRYTT